MVDFDHRDVGTAAHEWDDAKAALPSLSMPDPSNTVLAVLGAHPDDETLGVGALIGAFVDQGGKVEIGLATAGEGADPVASEESKKTLAARRLAEFSQATRRLDLGERAISTSYFDLPDGKLESHEELLSEKLEAWLTALQGKIGGADLIVVAPYRHDGHSDHEALGRAAKELADRHSLPLWEYPIWYWHWGAPEEPQEFWQSSFRFDPTPAELERKNSAIAEHASQLQDLGDGQGPILSTLFLQHFTGAEIFSICRAEHGEEDAHSKQIEHTSLDAARVFDEVHLANTDPWDCESSWYEKRKRSVSLALLSEPEYKHGLEIGCSVGFNTVELAGRCTVLTAADASATALALARERVAGLKNVELIHGTIPQQWPQSSYPEPFDLVVISEVGYYFSAEDLVLFDEWIREQSTLGCQLLLCHWRHPIEGWEGDAESVHRFFLESENWELVSSLEEPDTLQHVLNKKST